VINGIAISPKTLQAAVAADQSAHVIFFRSELQMTAA
jgi:hypothetical protein